VLEPRGDAVPVVACLPHGGLYYPAELAAELAVHPDVLWSDWLTRDLYAFLPDLGITTVTTTFSRFVADVNRDPDGEQHGGFWTSVVAARMPNGRAVYRRPLTDDEIAHRIKIAHAPFHRALDEVVARLLARFPKVLLLDLHSFGVGLDGDVILGDRHGTTASPTAVGLVSGALGAAGLDVRMNHRFAGGWTVRRFGHNDLVEAIQVELNQRRYLDLENRRYPAPPPVGEFAATQRMLRATLQRITGEWGQRHLSASILTEWLARHHRLLAGQLGGGMAFGSAGWRSALVLASA
jgi:N-formylglutamate deformylase